MYFNMTMKHFLLILTLVLSGALQAQFNLNNALVIGQLDKPEDRFAVEINITELFSEAGVKSMASLNVLKLGSNPEILGTDSVRTMLKNKGIDTYVLVFVRGYDKKFKPTQLKDDLNTALNAGSLFPIYREEVSSVSFEFLFYRDGQMIGSDIIRCTSVSSLDGVIKKLRKGLRKKLAKSWRK